MSETLFNETQPMPRQSTQIQKKHKTISSQDVLLLNRDAIFYVLLGSNVPSIMKMLSKSAQRIVQDLNDTTANNVLQLAHQSIANMKTIFVIFLYIDPVLRKEISNGTALCTKTQCLCPYKAANLYKNLYDNVISNWIKSELTCPLELIQTFTNEYLVS